MKNIIMVLLVFTVDIYQDRNRSIVVIEHDGETDLYPVKNSQLNDSFVERIVERYDKAKVTRILPRE
jgi:hypothetical protein